MNVRENRRERERGGWRDGQGEEDGAEETGGSWNMGDSEAWFTLIPLTVHPDQTDVRKS